jgi:hypothetical protein
MMGTWFGDGLPAASLHLWHPHLGIDDILVVAAALLFVGAIEAVGGAAKPALRACDQAGRRD